MADIVYVLVIVAFFALATVFVQACDRIIGPDDTSALVSGGAGAAPEDPLAEVGGGDPEQAPVASVGSVNA